MEMALHAPMTNEDHFRWQILQFCVSTVQSSQNGGLQKFKHLGRMQH
jgi:thermostable 8-oxoguanine DNA glycosylase